LEKATQNVQVQKWIAGISVLLLSLKCFAYYLTHSVAILTDALESIVNVAAGFIGLYSLSVAARPRDRDHPYGHGKAEFLSAAVEGTLILCAGGLILYKAAEHLLFPVAIAAIDRGIFLVGCTAVINLGAGYVAIRNGKKNNSLALIASGRHLVSDCFSTFGIIIGLLLLMWTRLVWIDSVVAMVFAVIILVTGYRILRKSIAGIMDEADAQLLGRLVALLNKHRRSNWVDLHNLRVIKYGNILHLDCHLTVPWYLNVHEAHREIDALAELVRDEFDESIELFVHSDGCQSFSCPLCTKTDCAVRQHPFVQQVEWTLENILRDQKHQIR
jgi:cation diffusion facilitator family transporter